MAPLLCSLAATIKATERQALEAVEGRIADRILNHKQGVIRGVAAIYNRHAYLDERRAALVQWAEHVLRLVDLAQNVAPLRAHR